MRSDGRAADRNDADALMRPVAESLAQVLAAAESLRMSSENVARKIEMPGDPFAHGRKVRAERLRQNVIAIADENGAISHGGMPLDMLDHLGVVVGRQKGLAVAARRHRHKANEVGEPGQRRLLEL